MQLGRLSRIGMETDIEMEDILGEKRRVGSSEDQSKLPTKRRVSQGGKKNKLIVAKVGSQPCQDQ